MAYLCHGQTVFLVFLNRSHPFWGSWGSQLFGILVVHHNPIVTRLGVENRRGS
jgi:hypothetical protein